MERRSSNRILYSILIVLVGIALSYQVRYSREVIGDLLDQDRASRPPMAIELPWPAVGSVRPEAAAAGLRAGDKVTAIDGEPNRGTSVLARALARKHSGESIRVTIDRGGKLFESGPIKLVAEVDVVNPLAAWALNLTLLVGMPALCILTGCWVVFMRVRDPLAWLLFAVLLSFIHIVEGNVRVSTWEPQWHRIAAATFRNLSVTSWPVWMMLFGIYFPRPLPLDLRMPWLKWLLIVPLVVFAALQAALTPMMMEDVASVEWLVPRVRGLVRGIQILIFISVSVFFASLSRKWAGAANPDVRRRLRLLVTGASVALAPMSLLLLYAIIRNIRLERLDPRIATPAAAMMALFPVTLAYVIVVHRALDVRVVIRQGVQYALARGGLRILTALLMLAVILAVSSLLMERELRLVEIFLTIAFGSLAVLALHRLSRRLAEWIDRRFFRAAYDAEHVLGELSESVRTIVEMKPLMELVTRRISETLHVEQVAMMMAGDGRLRPAYAVGYGGTLELEFPAQSRLAESLRRSRGPVRLYLDDEESWAQKAMLPPEEVEALKKLQTQLLLPLAIKEKLLGFISLGPKKSEEAYSRTDLRLLNSVAVQTGLALENSHLTEEVAKQAAQRERMLREIEIAREVQERLFPQKLPEIPGLDYAGTCRPARGVGGDYYDFLNVSEKFGMAIGDVAGKGISAALLMASLQASLRSQAIALPPDLATLMCNMNRLIHENTPSNRYATFFYCQYNPATRELVYVNAGHNAPIVLRGEQSFVLDKGGPPIGLFGTARYEEAAVRLQAGDIVVMFTDGVSEALNPQEVEWGESSLCATVKANASQPAAEILPLVLAAADEFANGAPQHDDMTLVVVKVL
jgi:sigma-B regulation protein RsbU (phosphoserine phosphatase)